MQYFLFFLFFLSVCINMWKPFVWINTVSRRIWCKNGNIKNGLCLDRNAYICSFREQLSGKKIIKLATLKVVPAINASILYSLCFHVGVIFKPEKSSFYLTCTIALQICEMFACIKVWLAQYLLTIQKPESLWIKLREFNIFVHFKWVLDQLLGTF